MVSAVNQSEAFRHGRVLDGQSVVLGGRLVGGHLARAERRNASASRQVEPWNPRVSKRVEPSG